MKRFSMQALLALMLLLVHLSARGEDIDLFVSVPPADPSDRPNVLIILDNTGNWNTAFANEMQALVNTFNGLPANKFNVGLMLFGDPDVGYVRAAIRPMTADNRARYADMIRNFHITNDRGNARTLARTFSEAHRYLKGLASTVPAATTGSVHNQKRDYTRNTAGNAFDDAVHELPGNALDNAADFTYTSPINPSGCGGTYIIYIGNTVPGGNVVQDNTARNSAAGAELAAAGGSTTQIPLAYTSHQDNFADEWARFLKQNMGVITYAVDVDPTPMPGGHNRGMGNSALLKSMADSSGGKYFRVNSSVGGGAEIAEALDKIFSEILAVNTVFASVSLPVSVSSQNTYLNQVYIGMFRPEASAGPRWHGNLKQYKLGVVGDQLKLVYDVADNDTDSANDQPAINNITGFITECARSYWTPTTTDTYWTFDPKGNCLAVANSQVSNYPDGNIVEKGAQGFRLRNVTPASRTLRTCSPVFASCNALTDFVTGNPAITAALLGAADATERTTLINWARGQDVDDENGNGNTTEMRPSVHGDVVHSRPVAINYGTDAAPQVVVFYGDNNGVLRAINGNRHQSIGANAAGSEMWGFVPPEFYGQFKRLREESPAVSYQGTTGTPTPLPKPYGIDGPLVAYRGTGTTPPTYLYAAMRRGGRALYAFNVTAPANPSLAWKIGCPNNFAYPSGSVSDTGCTAGLTGIGQTWSTPSVIMAQGFTGGSGVPLLIMGGGYDPCEDTDNGTNNHSCTASTKGNKLYVINAMTGAVVRTFDTDRAVVGGVTVHSINGFAEYGYAADLGGNVYRITIRGLAEAAWSITKVASLGCSGTGTCPANRKFMFAPDVVFHEGAYHLLVGSGDREKPLPSPNYVASNNVANYFFMVRDMPADATWLSSESGNCGGASVICLNSLTPIPAGGDAPSTISDKGWYLGMVAGEQVVTSAITVSNVVTFSTHRPTAPVPGSCVSNLGETKVYNISFLDASSRNRSLDGSRYGHVSGDGLPPSPVAGIVRLDDGREVPFIIGGSPTSPLEAALPLATAEWDQPKQRVYWYLEQ